MERASDRDAMLQRIEALELQVTRLTEQRITEQRLAARKSRTWGRAGVLAAMVAGVILWSPSLKAAAPTVFTDDVIIDGGNLIVRNGLGTTTTTNGKGNIVVGYNESRPGGDLRTGSHNLIVGIRQNFTSFGGVVAGIQNDISAPWASVTGGTENAATGLNSSISGGENNRATAQNSHVSGGGDNQANSRAASVLGGQSNVATGGDYSAVSGGFLNEASGQWASATGGLVNDATGTASAVHGGQQNNSGGTATSILGGFGISLFTSYTTSPPTP